MEFDWDMTGLEGQLQYVSAQQQWYVVQTYGIKRISGEYQDLAPIVCLKAANVYIMGCLQAGGGVPVLQTCHTPYPTEMKGKRLTQHSVSSTFPVLFPDCCWYYMTLIVSPGCHPKQHSEWIWILCRGERGSNCLITILTTSPSCPPLISVWTRHTHTHTHLSPLVLHIFRHLHCNAIRHMWLILLVILMSHVMFLFVFLRQCPPPPTS